MSQTKKDIIFLTLLTIITTLLVWAPFLLRIPTLWGLHYPTDGMTTIIKNYDGLNYVVVAKTWYDPIKINEFFSEFLPPIYYAAHFPLFPLFILIFSTVLGFFHSLIFVTLLFSVLASIVFYFLLREVGIHKHLVWLSSVFLLFPARFVVVRSIGAPEPLFLTLVLLSLLLFLRKNYLLSGLFGALATLTRSPGLLLFVGYALAIPFSLYKQGDLTKLNKWPKKAILGIILIPLSLLTLFFLYSKTYGDFFAYFHSGDNIHLTFPPFQVFNTGKPWVGTFWLEDVIYVYLLSILAVITLFKKRLYPLAFFALTYFLAIISVEHRDISRYSIPMYPLFIIAFSDLLCKKEFKIALALLLPAIYLFVQNFLLNNVAPIADFTPFL